MTDNQLLEAVGGKRMSSGSSSSAVWNFGWEPSDNETLTRCYAAGIFRDHDPNEDVPEIKGDKVELYPEVKLVYGEYRYNWQIIGSCVHGGGENGIITRQCQEIIHAARQEAATMPFGWMAYAAARSNGNPNRAEGDGASGTLYAEKLAEVGTPPIDTPGIPKPLLVPVADRSDAKAILWTQASIEEFERLGTDDRRVKGLELKYSTLKNIPKEWIEAAIKHKLQFIRCRSEEEVERELRRRRPILAAGDWGGRMKCSYKGEPRVLWNEEASSWAHQQSILGFWRHPTLGRSFRWQNQWYYMSNGVAVPMHGAVTGDEPPGGYWTSSKDVNYQARNGEVFAIYGLEGYDGNAQWINAA